MQKIFRKQRQKRQIQNFSIPTIVKVHVAQESVKCYHEMRGKCAGSGKKFRIYQKDTCIYILICTSYTSCIHVYTCTLNNKLKPRYMDLHHQQMAGCMFYQSVNQEVYCHLTLEVTGLLNLSTKL